MSTIGANLRSRSGNLAAALRNALSGSLAPASEKPHKYTLLALCLGLFLFSLSVRLIHAQDQSYQIAFAHQYLYDQPRHYQGAGRRILNDGLIRYFTETYNDRGTARFLLHPPGYPILISVVFAICGDSSDALRMTQIVVDALAVVVLFLIAVRLLSIWIAAISGVLCGASPHFAYNALVLQPDSLTVVPILCAILVLILAWRRQSFALVAVSGLLLGSSCWLRSNAGLLPVFLAVLVIPALFSSGARVRAAVILVLAAIFTIAPMTIRNWLAYGRFVPISIGAGITMIEGIGDFDPDRQFGFPSTDKEVALAEAQWYGRPDYGRAIWAPDGIQRDRDRLSRGVNVIVRHPIWFSSVMVRRAGLMLRYNDEHTFGWPADTSIVPLMSAEPTYGHPAQPPNNLVPEWRMDAAELFGQPISENTASASGDHSSTEPQMTALHLDSSAEVVSEFITINPHSDYLLTIPIENPHGSSVLEVTDSAGRVLVASPIVRRQRLRDEEGRNEARGVPQLSNLAMPFAAGSASTVQIRLRKADGWIRPVNVGVGPAELFDLGATPGQWLTRPRAAINDVQAHIYRTNTLRVLMVLGAGALLIGGRRKELLVISAVPLYYLIFQSALHTEYRYILIIHYLSCPRNFGPVKSESILRNWRVRDAESTA